MALDNTNTLLNRFHSLPFLTDGGIETYLIHHDGLDLPISRHSRCCGKIRGVMPFWRISRHF